MAGVKIDFEYLNNKPFTELDAAYVDFVRANCADESNVDTLIRIAGATFTKAEFRKSENYRAIKSKAERDNLKKLAAKLSKDDLAELSSMVK